MWSVRREHAEKAIRRSPAALALLVVCAQGLVTCLLLAAIALWRAAAPGPVEAYLGLMLLGTMLTAAVAWNLVSRPFEAALRENRRTLRSLFVENPEAIGVYDRDGRIMRGNKAAADMLDQPAEVLIGAHFTDHMAPEHVAEARAAFDRVLLGEAVAFETVFLGARGKRIEVRSTLFPYLVDGLVAGAFGVAKDIGDLKRATQAYDEQAQRITELYALAASPAGAWRQQIQSALALACRCTGYDRAFLVEMVEDQPQLLASAGPEMPEGEPSLRDDQRLLRKVLATSTVLVMETPVFGRGPFLGASIHFGEASSAVLGVEAIQPREHSLTPADCYFVRLVAALAGSAIERGRQEERLDRLAVAVP